SFVIRNVNRADLDRTASELGVQVSTLNAAPGVKTHPLRAARIAFVHTWLSTQTEGWWRLALDKLGIPYDYLSTQTVAKIPDLNVKYDVILFPPAGGWGGSVNAIVNGVPTAWGNALPWKNTPETPNLAGKNDSTDDLRPGLGWDGVARLQEFVQRGGVLLTATDTSSLALALGFVDGISTQSANKMKIIGSVVGTRLVDDASPIAYGYDEKGAAYWSEIWESPPVLDEQKRNGFRVIPPALRPRVIFRYADSKDLLISGLVEGGDEIAQHPAVVDARSGKGHLVLFSINPVYRGETWGTYSMVLNAILNFDNLNEIGRAHV